MQTSFFAVIMNIHFPDTF